MYLILLMFCITEGVPPDYLILIMFCITESVSPNYLVLLMFCITEGVPPNYLVNFEVAYIHTDGDTNSLTDTQQCLDLYKSQFLVAIDDVILPGLESFCQSSLFGLANEFPEGVSVTDVTLETLQDADYGSVRFDTVDNYV